MVRLLLLIIAIAVLGCTQRPKPVDEIHQGSSTNMIEESYAHTAGDLPIEVITEIKNHYYGLYKDKVVFLDYADASHQGDSTVHVESETDSLIDIDFGVKFRQQEEDEWEDDEYDYDAFLITIKIAKYKGMYLFGATPVVYGDLDSDGLEDLVVSVHTEGGGQGGNVWSQDIFLFIQDTNSNYTLASITSDEDISGCELGGDFRVWQIKDGLLLGESLCYDNDDARCCPSLNYLTFVGLNYTDFVFLMKELIED
jgi:hypothetical protein